MPSALDPVINDETHHCLQGMIASLNLEVTANVLSRRSIGLPTSFFYSGTKGPSVRTVVSKNASLSHIDGMVFCCQTETLVENKRSHGCVLGEKSVGLRPGSLALVGGIVAAGFKGECRVVEEGVDLFFDVVGKTGWVRPCLIHVLECVFDWHHRHLSFNNIFILISAKQSFYFHIISRKSCSIAIFWDIPINSLLNLGNRVLIYKI